MSGTETENRNARFFKDEEIVLIVNALRCYQETVDAGLDIVDYRPQMADHDGLDDDSVDIDDLCEYVNCGEAA